MEFEERFRRDKDLQAAIQIEHHFYQKILNDPQLLLMYIRVFKLHSIREALVDVIRRMRECENLLQAAGGREQ